ncbi:hypothetical protein SNE40_001238 [Patella caerulea]|uniref:(3R)-3-hydroxyacyl-CoA dehydrogenase n=1 Tax=Patella caerulea TaxID=87958 RepID=A0AAN8KC33_PATCE
MASTGLLAGRLALVTGGGSGIGKAVCQAFAKEGARIACVDINKSNAESTVENLPTDVQHAAFEVNVSSANDVKNLLKDVTSTFSTPPCIAVNSAGITRDNFLLKLDEKSFDEVIDVNLKGTFLINQAVGRLIAEHKIKNGSIVNIASITGKAGNIGQANYAASKAGVIGLTKTAAREFSRYGIRVNVVLPGFIVTPMTDTVPDKVFQQMVLPLIPLARMGQPEEIADTCVFLASNKSSYVTGASIEVTGGMLM